MNKQERDEARGCVAREGTLYFLSEATVTKLGSYLEKALDEIEEMESQNEFLNAEVAYWNSQAVNLSHNKEIGELEGTVAYLKKTNARLAHNQDVELDYVNKRNQDLRDTVAELSKELADTPHQTIVMDSNGVKSMVYNRILTPAEIAELAECMKVDKPKTQTCPVCEGQRGFDVTETGSFIVTRDCYKCDGKGWVTV